MKSFPQRLKKIAVELYEIKCMSCPKIAELFRKKGYDIHHTTIVRWVRSEGKIRKPKHRQKLIYRTGEKMNRRRMAIQIAAKLRNENFQINQIVIIMNHSSDCILRWLNEIPARQYYRRMPGKKYISGKKRPDINSYKEILTAEELEFIKELRKLPKRSGFRL